MVFDLGIVGTAVAKFVEELLNLIIIYLYIRNTPKYDHSFVRWESKYIEKDAMISQAKFCATVTMSTFFDIGIFVFMSILGTSFDLKNAVANVAVMSISNFTLAIVISLTTTGLVYVATCIGQGRPNKAKYYAWTSYVIVMVSVVLTGLMIIFHKEEISSFLADEPEVREHVEKVLIIWVMFVYFFDSQNEVFGGVLKTVGKQNEATFGILVCVQVIGIPLMWYMSEEKKMYTYGMWMGFGIASMLLLSYLFWRFLEVDWVDCYKQMNESMDSAKPKGHHHHHEEFFPLHNEESERLTVEKKDD